MPGFSKQSVFITGASGFVGGHLARRLLAEGAQVSLLWRGTSNPAAKEEFIQKGARIVDGDITERELIFSAIEGHRFVFHCAALYREAKFPDSEYFRVNLEGTQNVLDAAAAAKVERIVHTSTIGVHSHIKNPPANESEPYLPTDVYQQSKVEAEKYALQLFNSGGVKGSILRPAMIWGEADKRFLKLFRGIAKRTLPIIGSGKTWTHWIYVQDLVDAYLLAAEKPQAIGQLYIVAGRSPVLLEDVFLTIAHLAKVEPLPIRIPAWPIQWAGSVVEMLCKPFGIEPPLHRRRCDFFVKNRWFDTRKIQSELGFKPRYDFATEASIIFNWYKEHGWLD